MNRKDIFWRFLVTDIEEKGASFKRELIDMDDSMVIVEGGEWMAVEEGKEG